jgi:hypothetical protein
MIKFFRKIRQDLLSEGRVAKYLKYAVGEILLVVIGILIALQVNNWNEGRKERILERQYLERLVQDLQRDTAYYAGRISGAELDILHLDSFLHEMYIPLSGPDDFTRIMKHSWFGTDDLNLKNSTYRELTSTGSMNIISDLPTKESILGYYQLGEELSSQIAEYNQFATRILTNAIMSVPAFAHLVGRGINGDLALDMFDDQRSDTFLTIEQVAVVYMLRNREHLGHFRVLKEAATQLITQIENEN